MSAKAETVPAESPKRDLRSTLRLRERVKVKQKQKKPRGPKARAARRHVRTWVEATIAAVIAAPLALVLILSLMPEQRYALLSNEKLTTALNFFFYDDAGPPKPPSKVWLARLSKLDVAFAEIPDRKNARGGCGYEGAVRVTRIGKATIKGSTVITWPLAVKIEEWMRTEVQPTAQRLFGQPVVELAVSSSYDCRFVKMRRVLSQHSYANAIDITGLTLADGRHIRVMGTWQRGKGAFAVFLKRIGGEACGIFPVALTPDFDYQHRHHFHFDVGRRHFCGFGKWRKKMIASKPRRRHANRAQPKR